MVVRRGLSSEMNPIVVAIAEEHGLVLLTMAKTSVVLLVASLALVVGRQHPKIAGTVLGVGVLVGAVGAFSNVLAF